MSWTFEGSAFHGRARCTGALAAAGEPQVLHHATVEARRKSLTSLQRRGGARSGSFHRPSPRALATRQGLSPWPPPTAPRWVLGKTLAEIAESLEADLKETCTFCLRSSR